MEPAARSEVSAIRNATASREITAESIRHRSVRIRYSHAVRGIECPVRAATKPETAAVAVMVEEEAVYENRPAEPIRPPAPTTPSQSAEESTNVDPRPESKSNSWIVERRVVAIDWRSPNVFWIVRRHINHLRISRLDLNGSLVSLRLCRDPLLPVRIEFAIRSRFRAHVLHGIHNVRLLSQERISQIGSPSNVGIQPIENIRKNYQSLNARIPILLARGVHQL